MKSLFTVRKRKHTKHPQVIVGVNKTKFKSMTITHSKLNGRHDNIELDNNPNPMDKRKSYVQRRIISDFKFRFSEAFKNYKLSNEDIDKLIKYLESSSDDITVNNDSNLEINENSNLEIHNDFKMLFVGIEPEIMDLSFDLTDSVKESCDNLINIIANLIQE